MSGKLATGGSASSGAQSRKPSDQNVATASVAVRPVRVDEAGRLFEMSGEPIEVLGLAPEDVLQGIEDERRPCAFTR